MRRTQLRRAAEGRVNTILKLALETAKWNPDLARRQGELARRICLKHNIRLGYGERMLFCHGCKGLIIPGLNARVRIKPRQYLLVTCLDCGHVYRRPLRGRRGTPTAEGSA